MLFDAVDNYCERLASGLLAEPLNAISNLSFFLAAWLLYRQYRALSLHNREIRALIILIAIVGLGSLGFHTFANVLSMFGDIIPIVVFVCYYLWICLRRLLGWNAGACFAAVGLLLASAAALTALLPHTWSFNGSITYFPCLAAVLLIGRRLRQQGNPAARSFFAAGGWFALSLAFRSIDMAACPAFPLGTHFLWHLMNGVVLYILTRALLVQRSSV